MEDRELMEWVVIPATLLLITIVTLLVAPRLLWLLAFAIDLLGRFVVDGLLGLFPRATRRIRRVLRWTFGLLLVGLAVWAADQLQNLSVESPVVGTFIEETVQGAAKLLWIPALFCMLFGLIFWFSSPTPVLFYHRRVKFVWQRMEALRGSVLMFGEVPLLGGGIKIMRGLIEKIQVRWCRRMLILLFYLSIFTFPVQVFPLINSLIYEPISPYLTWPFRSLLGLPDVYAKHLGHFYLLLFDWVLLVALCYGLATNLSRLSRRNLFHSVPEAIAYYIQDPEIEFQFGAYYWRDGDGTFQCPVECSKPVHDAKVDHFPRWNPLARQLHAETERLDKPLSKTWQGSNSRVSLVFTAPAEGEAPAQAVCFHYHRFGNYGFVVAVDDEPTRFAGESGQSQDDFQQLVQGIGQLINVRDSLK